MHLLALLRLTHSDKPFLYLQALLFVLYLLAIVLSVVLRSTDSDEPFGIFKLLCLSFIFGNCVACPSSIYGFWLPLWYLQHLLFALYLLAIVLSVLLRFTESDYPFGIFKFFCFYFVFWPLCCLSFFDLRILNTPLLSSNFSPSYILFLWNNVLWVLNIYIT